MRDGVEYHACVCFTCDSVLTRCVFWADTALRTGARVVCPYLFQAYWHLVLLSGESSRVVLRSRLSCRCVRRLCMTVTALCAYPQVLLQLVVQSG